MLGAIIGDMVGAPYEFDRGDKSKDFDMWNPKAQFTDDTVMTIAVADALNTEFPFSINMRAWAEAYPGRGYGGMFAKWIHDPSMGPYYSFGNGSAMRVSPAAWYFDEIGLVRFLARKISEVTHNHPEGIKGAEATASAILMARKGNSKDQIREYVEQEFGYNLHRTCDEIRPTYEFNETCQKTVPEAITAFLESNGFEDAIKLAISLGGDSDTLAAITGSIAEAYYVVPAELIEKANKIIPPVMVRVIDTFESKNVR